jgi:hypothetical protein
MEVSMTPLDFAAERDESTASWQRADPTGALIERIAWDTWLLTLPDSETTYEVSLHRDHGALMGECEVRDEPDERCPARKYNDAKKPCAHLCTLRKAMLFNDPDISGQPIKVFDVDDAAIAANDTHIETAMAADQDVATDGGREVFQR